MTDIQQQTIRRQLLKKKHEELIQAINQLINAFAGEEKLRKVNANLNCLKVCHQLQEQLIDVVAEPEWLISLLNWTQWYSENYYRDDANSTLLTCLIDLKSNIEQPLFDDTKVVEDTPTSESSMSERQDFDLLLHRLLT